MSIWPQRLPLSSSPITYPSISPTSPHPYSIPSFSISPQISTTPHLKYSHNNSSYGNPKSTADQLLDKIQDSGIIACVRAKTAELAIEASRSAFNGGISVLEVVMTTPGVFEVIQCLVQEYPSKSIGVGTVLNIQDAKNAIKHGAKFLMSPVTVVEILDHVAENQQALYVPGVMTPTEIIFAYNAGAKIVKVYPVSALGGVKYIAAINKMFPHIPMVASQGIMMDEMSDYIGSGASGVVLSDAIFDKVAMENQDFDRIKEFARIASVKGYEAVRDNRMFDLDTA